MALITSGGVRFRHGSSFEPRGGPELDWPRVLGSQHLRIRPAGMGSEVGPLTAHCPRMTALLIPLTADVCLRPDRPLLA